MTIFFTDMKLGMAMGKVLLSEERCDWRYENGELCILGNTDLVLEAYEVEDAVALASVRLCERRENIGQRWRILAQYEDEDENFMPSFALGSHKMGNASSRDEEYRFIETRKKVEAFQDRAVLETDTDIKDIEWKRPDEIVSHPKFVTSGISRFDINQGALGDCWAVSVMANLAGTMKAHPQITRQIFDPDQSFENGNHLFTFNFFKNGKWKEVTVDDYLPMESTTSMAKEVLFCSSADPDEFWPCLMEKAYAKFKGSYADLVGDRRSVALHDMTGQEWEQITVQDDMYYDVADYITSHGLVLAGGTKGDESSGIVLKHAYSVTGFGGDVVHGKCLRLRNPWGTGEYEGVEAHILNNNKEDGEFVIKWDTFLQYFSNLTVKITM